MLAFVMPKNRSQKPEVQICWNSAGMRLSYIHLSSVETSLAAKVNFRAVKTHHALYAVPVRGLTR